MKVYKLNFIRNTYYNNKLLQSINLYKVKSSLPSMISKDIIQARQDLVQQTMEKIRDFREFSNFTIHVEVKFMHLGLQYKSETKAFLSSHEWSDSLNIEEYLQGIEEFLMKMIK